MNSNLIKEWDFKKNRDLNPKFVSCYSNKKVWWRCSKCNYSWRTAVAHRIEGKGCPVCGREKTISSHFKSVVCLETNIFYNSVKEAGEKNKINPSSISNCCRGVSKTAGGYHWKYVDKEKD